jgi:hypothetical protein
MSRLSSRVQMTPYHTPISLNHAVQPRATVSDCMNSSITALSLTPHVYETKPRRERNPGDSQIHRHGQTEGFSYKNSLLAGSHGRSSCTVVSNGFSFSFVGVCTDDFIGRFPVESVWAISEECRATGWMIEVRVPAGARNFSPHHRV